MCPLPRMKNGNGDDDNDDDDDETSTALRVKWKLKSVQATIWYARMMLATHNGKTTGRLDKLNPIVWYLSLPTGSDSVVGCTPGCFMVLRWMEFDFLCHIRTTMLHEKSWILFGKDMFYRKFNLDLKICDSERQVCVQFFFLAWRSEWNKACFSA